MEPRVLYPSTVMNLLPGIIWGKENHTGTFLYPFYPIPFQMVALGNAVVILTCCQGVLLLMTLDVKNACDSARLGTMELRILRTKADASMAHHVQSESPVT